jgi:protein arginine kinase
MQISDKFDGDGISGGEWLSTRGAHSDIVISSRVRLARNVRRHRFAVKAEPRERIELEHDLRYALGRVEFDEDMVYVDLAAASPIDAEMLVERHLVSRELARGDGPRAACYAPSESVCVMVCEEDHLRLQVLRSGFELDAAWEMADALDDRIARRVDYAFSSRYGYLTCCPTNVGTGLRASVMLHLPALVYSKHIEKVFQAGSKMNLAVRGLYGEGTQALGDFYQISNQVALGLSETDVLERLNRVVPQFIDYERRLRDALLKGDRARLEDRVWRAYGVLRAARTISSDETLELLSAIRLGVNLAILPGDLTIETVNELFITSQPAHLQKLSTGPMEPRERDVVRADLLRKKLGPL